MLGQVIRSRIALRGQTVSMFGNVLCIKRV
jgi:hypothetical protein